MSLLFLSVLAVGCASSRGAAAHPKHAAAHAPTPVAVANTPIDRTMVEKAQRAWCDTLVSIGSASSRNQDPKALAQQALSTAYGYDDGVVLFKPTLTHGEQTFRMDKRGALAYFVGGDPAYPNDSGFALKGWKTCQPAIKDFVADGNMAIAMGNVYMKDGKGNEVKVDKTFGYRRDVSGALKIVLHHSSLPYAPPGTTVSQK